jgi:hypothetical protein
MVLCPSIWLEKFTMDEYLRANQKLWNEWTGEHNMIPLLFSLKASKPV